MRIIEEYWFTILLLLIVIYISYSSQSVIERLANDIKIVEQENIVLQEKIDVYLITIDSLSNIDNTLIEEVEVIKTEVDEKIIIIDTMSISTLQSEFTKRYGK